MAYGHNAGILPSQITREAARAAARRRTANNTGGGQKQLPGTEDASAKQAETKNKDIHKSRKGNDFDVVT